MKLLLLAVVVVVGAHEKTSSPWVFRGDADAIIARIIPERARETSSRRRQAKCCGLLCSSRRGSMEDVEALQILADGGTWSAVVDETISAEEMLKIMRGIKIREEAAVESGAARRKSRQQLQDFVRCTFTGWLKASVKRPGDEQRAWVQEDFSSRTPPGTDVLGFKEVPKGRLEGILLWAASGAWEEHLQLTCQKFSGNDEGPIGEAHTRRIKLLQDNGAEWRKMLVRLMVPTMNLSDEECREFDSAKFEETKELFREEMYPNTAPLQATLLSPSRVKVLTGICMRIYTAVLDRRTVTFVEISAWKHGIPEILNEELHCSNPFSLPQPLGERHKRSEVVELRRGNVDDDAAVMKERSSSEPGRQRPSKSTTKRQHDGFLTSAEKQTLIAA